MRWTTCELCKKEKIPVGRQRFCGSYKRKTGCSYIKHKERQRGYNKVFQKRHPDWWRKIEEYRKRTGYYKRNLRALSAKRLARYHKAKGFAPKSNLKV